MLPSVVNSSDRLIFGERQGLFFAKIRALEEGAQEHFIGLGCGVFWSQENCHKALKNCIHGSYCSLFHEDLDPDLVSKSSELRSSEHLFHFFDFRVVLAVCPPTKC